MLKTWRQYNLGPFVLGTAQLGTPYGIANQLGQPSLKQAREILGTAWDQGVQVFDTASDYGESEHVLGRCLEELGISKKALIITKFSPACFCNEHSISKAMDESLHALRRTKVFAVLAHSASVLSNADHTSRLFKTLKEKNKVAFTGVSVYSVSEAKLALETENFDLVQLPLNVLDRRPLLAELTQCALDMNKLLLFRSAFLQGLLLLNPEKGLPQKVEFARSILVKWWQVCKDSGVLPHVAAIKIADQLAGTFPLIIGAESATQVSENVASLNKPLSQLNELLSLTEPIAKICPERVLNPSLW